MDHDKAGIEQGTVCAEKCHRYVMEDSGVLLDEPLMMDEQIAFNGCPARQKNARLKERVVDDNPRSTFALGMYGSSMQEIQCER